MKHEDIKVVIDITSDLASLVPDYEDFYFILRNPKNDSQIQEALDNNPDKIVYVFFDDIEETFKTEIESSHLCQPYYIGDYAEEDRQTIINHITNRKYDAWNPPAGYVPNLESQKMFEKVFL